MRIILSPAKNMRRQPEEGLELPSMLGITEQLLEVLRTMSFDELKKLWGCSDTLTGLNLERLSKMDLRSGLTPAVMAYDGSVFRHLAPETLSSGEREYLDEHLRILSAFYGVLRPFDGIVPYRLEMKSRFGINGADDLYGFWGSSLYEAVRDGSGVIINLASKEYSLCIEKQLRPGDRFVTVEFCELEGGRLRSKATYAKMARGEMLRYMAENRVTDPARLKGFDRLGYAFSPEHSDENTLVFVRTI